jgi:hypothetical protein
MTAMVTESSTNVVPLVERFFSEKFMADQPLPRLWDLHSGGRSVHAEVYLPAQGQNSRLLDRCGLFSFEPVHWLPDSRDFRELFAGPAWGPYS